MHFLLPHHDTKRWLGMAGFAQESRDELQRTKDQAEAKGEELEVCRQQSAELEMRLGTVQVMDANHINRNRVRRVPPRVNGLVPKGSPRLTLACCQRISR